MNLFDKAEALPPPPTQETPRVYNAFEFPCSADILQYSRTF